MEWIDNHFFFTILIIAWSTASAGKLIAILTLFCFTKVVTVFCFVDKGYIYDDIYVVHEF